ncbi:rhomboid family intramembrane serine protease [soil metagenome]
MPPVTPAVLILLVANAIVFALANTLSDAAIAPLALWPVGSGAFEIWQPVSYGFLHLETMQLLFNLFGLWMFGAELELLWGRQRFFTLWFASVVAAGLTQLLVDFLLGSPNPTLGASGGVFGLLLAFAMMFPERRVLVFFVIPLQARWFAVLYGLIELYQGVTTTSSGIAHFAHLGGMLGAWITMQFWRRRRLR